MVERCAKCGAPATKYYDPCQKGDPMCAEFGAWYCDAHYPGGKEAASSYKLLRVLGAASIFLRRAQMQHGSTEPGTVHSTIFGALGIEVDDSGTPKQSSLEIFHKRVVAPWIDAEIKSGNLKEGNKYGVKISAAPKNIRVMGTIDSREAPLSSRYFGAVSAAATKAVGSVVFEPFEAWLFSEQVLTFE